MPIKFVGEPFCVSKEFWYRKVSSKGGGSFTVLTKIFLSHRTEKTSPGNHSVFQKISGREKYFMDKRGGGVSRFSVEVFVSLYRNISLENALVFHKKFFYRKFSCIGGGGGGITVLSKFFVSQDRNEKLCKRTLLFSGIFLVSKKIYG